MASAKVTDIADIIAPDIKQEVIGIRPGEKLHECLITSEESVFTKETKSDYIIKPLNKEINQDRFSYNSLNNERFLDKKQLEKLLEPYIGE
jgi:FlaA1/EpsC-like NDP-sugar epimerase